MYCSFLLVDIASELYRLVDEDDEALKLVQYWVAAHVVLRSCDSRGELLIDVGGYHPYVCLLLCDVAQDA